MLPRPYFAALHLHQGQMFDAIMPMLAEDVVLLMAGDPSAIPFAGRFEGLDGVRELTRRFFSVLQVPDGCDHLPRYAYTSEVNRERLAAFEAIGSGSYSEVPGCDTLHRGSSRRPKKRAAF